MRVTVGAGRLWVVNDGGTGVGAQTISLRPGIGREFLVYELHIVQTDGVNHDLALIRTDGVNPFTLSQGLAVPSGTHIIAIGVNNDGTFTPDVPGPLRATRDTYLQVYSPAVWTDGTTLSTQWVIDDVARGY